MSAKPKTKLIPKTPFRVYRVNDKGFRFLGIEDAAGHNILTMIGRLDDREVELAHLICKAVNAAYPAKAVQHERN